MIKMASHEISQESSSVLSGITVEIPNLCHLREFLSIENRTKITNKPSGAGIGWIFVGIRKINEYETVDSRQKDPNKENCYLL